MDLPASDKLRAVPSAEEDGRDEAALPRDVYALLAQANLLRVRGHWEEAAQACMAALRLAPDTASANSLLGDIYENQGRYEAAAQWYEMALDANPDSPADRLKLDRLRQQGRQQESIRPAPQSGSQPSAPSFAPPNLTRRLRDPETALRYGAIAAALALALLVALAYHAVNRGAFGAEEAVVKTSPITVPPVAGTLPNDPEAAPVRDPSEQALLTALQAVPDLSKQGIVVYDVQADPRAGRMTVTFGLPLSAGLTQGAVAQDALRVLEAAGSVPSVQVWTARCLLAPSPPASESTLAFVGDAAPDAVQSSAAAGEALTDTQALSAFSSAWWSSTADIQA